MTKSSRVVVYSSSGWVDSFSRFLKGESNELSLGEGAADQLLSWLDLNQAQTATLLGVSPQAVSKGFKDEGVAFLAGRRAQRLYMSLTNIGGDRYALAAHRLKEVARAFGWGDLETDEVELTSPNEVYAAADEIWVVSDSPSAMVDWNSFRRHLGSGPETDQRSKLVVFFLRTLEGAERWAEVIERDFARPAVHEGRLDLDKVTTTGAYIFIVVTNAIPYAQDHLIVSPGSRCTEVIGSSKPPSVYQWVGGSYARARNPSVEFLRLVHRMGLGMGSVKASFFPQGVALTAEALDFEHTYIDGIIAIRGSTPEEDQSVAAEAMAGGILESHAGRSPKTLSFNKRAKFTPIFLLVYRRRPGEGMNERTPRIIQDELERSQALASNADTSMPPNRPFW